ncbi:MAG: HAMP domain-containing protein [Nitrospiraceae bacterium]|nr:HAMP domain-containing protein [Nitrospiraceae bacterium]
MFKSLWIKFLVLLLLVSLIALSSAFMLRELMIKDFRKFQEGEMEDKVYRVMIDIEGSYEKNFRWNNDLIIRDTVLALMQGLEIKIKDTNDTVVIDTEKALNTVTPLMKQKIMAITDFKNADRSENFEPYQLFHKGKEIGTLEVKFLKHKKEDIFIKRTNKFLFVSLLALGGVAILLSIIFSSRLTKPIKKLASAAKQISEGNLKSRVKSTGNDEIGKLSESFNIMAKSLELQESLRRRLISNTAHELRTPLSAMRGELEGIIDGLLPMNKEQIQSLYEETGRLKNILDGIEELTQAQISSLTLKKQLIEIKPFLKNIIERFNKSFLDKGVSIKLESDEKLIINADPDRLSQIVINLLSNALKATKKGGSVLIKTGAQDSETFLEIKDTGCGIKEEHLPYIFERFYRLSDDGLGLGLAIVKELVEAHSWRIEAKSIFDKGSTFTLYITD